MSAAARRFPGGLSLVPFAALLFSPLAALAAPCGRPDVDASYPPHGAVDVPANATLAAHYSAPAEYVDETVTLVDANGTDVTVDVAFDSAESMLRAHPLAELVPGTYEISWPALRGVSTNSGLGQTVEFTVGTNRDVEAPRFSGLSGIEWDLLREKDPCTDTHEDRFEYELSLGTATDDVDPSMLAVIVFETRGPDTGSAPEQVAIRPLPEKHRLRVERSAIGGEKVCFAAVTRDLVNNVSGGGEKQVCVETTEPPFFKGCSLARGASGGGTSAVLFASLLSALCRRWRARRG